MRYVLPLLMQLLMLTGCGALLPTGSELPLHNQMTPLPEGPVCRIAVLPFVNDSDYPLGDAIFSKVFSTQFQNETDYQASQEGDILKVYQQLHILPGRTPTLEQLRIVADRVNAQLLITGTVIEMRENRGEHGTVDPMIIAEIQLRNGHTGETLWTAYHRRQGTDFKKTMHFGTIHTVTGLSRQMAVEIINLWFDKGLPPCVSPRS